MSERALVVVAAAAAKSASSSSLASSSSCFCKATTAPQSTNTVQVLGLVHNTQSQQAVVTYAVVLVGGDCGENGLAKDEGLMRLLFELAYWRIGQQLTILSAPQNQVDSRLVLVH